MNAILVHDEMLNASLPIFSEHPAAPRLFVFDPQWMIDESWTMKRIQFVADGLMEIPNVKVFSGPISEVMQFAQVTQLTTQATPNHHLQAMFSRAGVDVATYAESGFVNFEKRLTRFTAYWKEIERQFFPHGDPSKAK